MALTSRWPVTLLGVVGALAAGIAGGVAEAPEVAGTGWAALAGLGLSLMLHRLGLRIVGALLVLLAVLGGVLAFTGNAWLAIAFVPVLVSGGAMATLGPGWKRRRPVRDVPSDDWWKRLDSGDDPTDAP